MPDRYWDHEMNHQARKGLLVAWLLLGAPVLGGLVAGVIGACAALLLQWLVDLPNRSFWFIVVVFAIIGLVIGSLHGWNAALLCYQKLRPRKNR